MRSFSTARRWPLAVLAVALGTLALPLATPGAGASDPRVTVGGTLPLAAGDVVVTKAIPASVDFALTQRHAAQLRSLVASLSDTASPNYHHYLTPSQYDARFGASAATVAKVRAYLAGYGLAHTTLSAGGVILRVTGSERDVAAALDAPVTTVRLATGVLTAHLTRAASLPQSVAEQVTAVAGLTTVLPESTNLERATSHASAATTAGACPSAGSSTGTTPNSLGGYTVQQQATLYGLNAQWGAGDVGTGQTVGVYELANYNASDLSTYFSCYQLTPTVTATNVDGGPSGEDNANNAPVEATLDVEEAAALAPGATFEVYQGTQSGSGPVDTYAEIASQDSASIITTSWGICEADTEGAAQAEQPIFEEMAAQGQTMVAAAGDSGSSDCAAVPGPHDAAVDDPASQPYVTGVGGLTVTDIDPVSESVWNDACTQTDCGAGGGGVSTLWSRPTWQVASGINATTDSMRLVPDVSVMGDPGTGFIMYYTSAGSGCSQGCINGWTGIGGTSIGAPLVAALVASAAQSCGGGRLGFINPALYAMSTTGFNDVTTGSNDLYGIGVYPAGPGYDTASGLGSPDGAPFFSGLCAASYSAKNSTFKVSSATGVINTAGPTVTASLRDANDKAITNAAVNVSASASAGTLTIDDAPASAAATGIASASLVSDASGDVAFTVSSTVAQSVAVSVTFEGQVVYSTNLKFAASAAKSTKPGAPSITSLTPLVGGFALRLKAPADDGGRPVTRYEYSINAGVTWRLLAAGKTAINVGSLGRATRYRVIARAINAVGPSAASAAKSVLTRA